MGILLLGALLVRAGRTGRRLEQAVLVAVTVVAFGGLALVVYPPTPFVVTVLGVLTAAPAALGRHPNRPPPRLSATARAGLAFLALAVAAAAASRALGALGAAFGLATRRMASMARRSVWSGRRRSWPGPGSLVSQASIGPS
ncbi:MAG: hypothetical protein M5T61_21660 [Acidimicrobiia bacterium]|nr:hypothetical protein [Acidimicrobiia bacterium]